MAGIKEAGRHAIASIVIDGYNLIGTDHRDLAAERDRLISMLAEYRKIRSHDITVVFDGWKSGGAREEIIKTAGIIIIYSRLGETADSVIRKIIAREEKEWVVISSDRAIAASAWSHGSIPVPSGRFLSALQNASQSYEGEYIPIDEEDEPGGRKGNPRMPSRKDKALLRVLRKL